MGGEIVRLAFSGRRNVGRRVVHHRARRAVHAGERRIVQLRVAERRRAFEVVAQPQRVPDLVHDRVVEPLLGVPLAVGRRGARVLLEQQRTERRLRDGVFFERALLAARPGGVLFTAERARDVERTGRLCIGVVRALRRQHAVDVSAFDRAQRLAVDDHGGANDLAGVRIAHVRAVRAEIGLIRRDPADGRVARVVRIEARIGRRILDDDRVGMTDLGERVVPGQDPAPHRVAVLRRDLVGQIKGDRAVVEVPPFDEALERAGLGVVAVTLARGDEIADPVVRVARDELRIPLGRCDDAVVHADRNAPPVGHGGQRVRRPVEREVDADLVVAREGFGRQIVRLARVDRERRPHGENQESRQRRRRDTATEIGADSLEIGEEQRRRHDDVLLGRILGDDRGREDHRVGDADRQRVCRRAALVGDVARVGRDPQDALADELERDGERLVDAPGEGAAAHSALDRRQDDVRLVEVLGPQVEEELVVLAHQIDDARLLRRRLHEGRVRLRRRPARAGTGRRPARAGSGPHGRALRRRRRFGGRGGAERRPGRR